MARSPSRPGRIILINLCISLAVTVLVLLFTEGFLVPSSPLHRIELSLIDLRFQQRGTSLFPRDTTQVVIVEISRETFSSLPEPWPWPKSYYTRLIRNLKRAGAKAVGIDVIFSTPDRANPESDR